MDVTVQPRRTIGPSDSPSASGQPARAAAHVAARGRRCPRRARRAPTSPTARSRPDRRASGSRAPRRCETHRDAAVPRNSRNVSSPRCLSARRRTSASVSPGPRASSFMYASASRLTLSPARAKETRPASESGRRNGSSSGRTSRTIRPPRWMFSIDPVIGMTSRPSSVTILPITESGGGNMCAPTLSARSPRCCDQMRPPTRSDASSTTGSRSRRRCAAHEAGDPPADDDDISLLSHGHLLSVMSSARASSSAALRTSGAIAPSRAVVRRTSGPVTETIATGRPAGVPSRRRDADDAELVIADRGRDARPPHLVELGADRGWVGQRERREGLDRTREEGVELGLGHGGEHELAGRRAVQREAPADPAHRQRVDAVDLLERREARGADGADDRALAGCVAQDLEQRARVAADGLLDAAGCE